MVNVYQFLFTTYIDALDKPKKSFKVTAVSVVVNIVLNIILIPVIGVNGAAIVTLATITLNALLARRALSKLMKIRMERHILLNVLIASIAMRARVGGYRLLIPFPNMLVTLLAVIVGGIACSVLLLKLDKQICDDLRKIMKTICMGVI